MNTCGNVGRVKLQVSECTQQQLQSIRLGNPYMEIHNHKISESGVFYSSIYYKECTIFELCVAKENTGGGLHNNKCSYT